MFSLHSEDTFFPHQNASAPLFVIIACVAVVLLVVAGLILCLCCRNRGTKEYNNFYPQQDYYGATNMSGVGVSGTMINTGASMVPSAHPTMGGYANNPSDTVLATGAAAV